MRRTRRTILKTSIGALAAGSIAGCITEDTEEQAGDENESTPDTDPEEDEADDHGGSETDSEPVSDDENEEQRAEQSLELLAEESIDHDHACLHAEFDPRTPLEAGESADESPTENETHVIWEVTYEGDAGYVGFDATQHEYDGPFVFYTAEGSATPVEGTEVTQGPVDDDDCADLDEYIEVEPGDGQILLELSSF